ncbi:hypothetical protein Pmani_032609 [Petrolisthes manimaculis]|uniref:Aromatic amino acid beta-eliminating lyase/threonine aldolase domain-containing protein n=1 Tax=Petrolisthes manimaculis TaxID=1843537 RepID=A0AAE1TRI4_9EUCA|nr:hypothetical protein Pmani_032609 [Petrolisthes manimaculis]
MERTNRIVRVSYRVMWRRMSREDVMCRSVIPERSVIPSQHTRQYQTQPHTPTTRTNFKGVVVDLRSDTITKPSDGMKKAMMDALVGDDVYREDPTVTELERRMAECTGKEAALFVPSGTMGNLISVLCHCERRGCEVLLGDLAHIFLYEQAGMAQVGGIQPHIIPTHPDGTFDVAEIPRRLRYEDVHCPRTSLVCLENTQNVCGGKVVPLQWIDEVGAAAESVGLPVHMDGARLMNASVASGVSLERILQVCQTASICFSKGLGTPVGSVIVGPEKFIYKAIRLRKVLGGGMRQSGMLAAAAIYSLDHMVQRLAQDHHQAQLIATAISEEASTNVTCHPKDVHTNIVIVNLNPDTITPDQFCERLVMISEDEIHETGDGGGGGVLVKVMPWTATTVRFVTHLDASPDLIQAAITKLKENVRLRACLPTLWRRRRGWWKAEEFTGLSRKVWLH